MPPSTAAPQAGEIGDEQKKTVATVRGVLNAAQLVKLKALEDAVKLQPLISDAVCENLMSPPAPQPTGLIRGTPGGVIGGVIGIGDAGVSRAFPMPFVNCVRGIISPMPMIPPEHTVTPVWRTFSMVSRRSWYVRVVMISP